MFPVDGLVLQQKTLPSQTPTQTPTQTIPSLIIPTSVPTTSPVGVPTNLPTNLPTNVPTSVPTIVPNSLVSSTSPPTDMPNIDTNNQETSSSFVSLKEWSAITNYIVYGSVIVDNIICGFTFHKCTCCNCKSKSGSDSQRYISIFRFIHSIGDLWTDLMFSLSLYIEYLNTSKASHSRNGHRDEIFYLFLLSCLFVTIPYIVSIIVGLVWIQKWRLTKDSGVNRRLVKIRFPL